MRPPLHGLRCRLACLLCLATAAGAAAGERSGGPSFHNAGHRSIPGGYGYGYGGYGFAGPAIGGDYVGAPLTRFPRPNEIVPPAWGYGTFGVPTMTGIRQAPTAPPSLTIVEGVGPAPRPRGPGARVPSRNAGGQWPGEAAASEPMAGIRVISVRVPRR